MGRERKRKERGMGKKRKKEEGIDLGGRKRGRE